MTKRSNASQDSSSSFTEDNEQTRVRKFAKHMLKSTLFMGTFQEKRFVEPLDSYRDVIKIADDETDLIGNLIAVRKRCMKFFSKDVWIGITEPKTIGAPAGYNVWVSLEEEVFGCFWYKIKNVEFHQNEVCLRLEIVRPVSREKTPVHNITPQQVLADISQRDFSDLSIRISNYFKEVSAHFFSETLTYTNVKEAIVFIFLLTSTLIAFLVHTIKYLLDYLLKLLHEMSGLVKACTPITINLIKLLANTINGFYNMIVALWRDRSTPTVNQNLYQMLPPYQTYTNYRALDYHSYQKNPPRNRYFDKPYVSQVRITPLD